MIQKDWHLTTEGGLEEIEIFVENNKVIFAIRQYAASDVTMLLKLSRDDSANLRDILSLAHAQTKPGESNATDR